MGSNPTILQLNNNFVAGIQGAFGEAGKAWLRQLPVILDNIAERWSLSLDSALQEFSYNYLIHARTAEGEDLVLKLGVPNQALRNEIAALRAFGWKGMVKLIDADAEMGALLLEDLRPGKPLTILTDCKATSIASDLMRQLQKADGKRARFPFRSRLGQVL